jgi:hypothetical protein
MLGKNLVLSLIICCSAASIAQAKTAMRILPFDPDNPTLPYVKVKSKDKSPPVLSENGGFCLNEAVVYYLPRQVVQATVTYSLYSTKIWHNSTKHGDPDEVRYYAALEKPAQILLVSVPDQKLGFQVSTNKLRGFATNTQQAKLSLTDDGVLTGIDMQFSDRTEQMIENLASTAANIAVTAGALGAQPGYSYETVLIKDLDFTKVIDPNDSSRSKPSTDPKGFRVWTLIGQVEIDTMNAYLSQMEEDKLTDSPLLAQLWISQKPNLIQNTSANLIGAQKYFDGIIVRVPAMVDFRIYGQALDTSGLPSGTPVLNFAQTANLAQTGGFARLGVASKIFADTTKSIQLSPSGGISSFGTTSTSQGEAITNTMKNVSGSVSTAVSGFLGGGGKK